MIYLPFQLKREVTAQINPGFFDFKKKFNELDHWTQKIKEEFHVEINRQMYSVKGSYRNVSALKYYLDFKFPEDPSQSLVEDIFRHVQNDPIHKRATREPVEVLVEVDEDFAEAFDRLYQCDEVEGVSKWQYSADHKGLCVTCRADARLYVEHIKECIKRKAHALIKDSCYFEDANESMFAESVCGDLQMSMEGQVYLKFVSQESKVEIIAKDRELANIAKSDLLQKVRKSVSGTEPMQDGRDNVSSEKPDAKSHSHHTGTSIKVRIYKEDIVNLPVNAIIIAAGKSANKITGIQKLVLDSAGEDVKLEYLQLFSGTATMESGDLKATSAGKLQFKKLYHIYLPQYKPNRERNIDQIAVFEDVLVKTFKSADKDGITSVGLPFIGSGMYMYNKVDTFYLGANLGWVLSNLHMSQGL